MNPFMIYLWLSLDSILNVLEFLVILCATVLFLYVIFASDLNKDDMEKARKCKNVAFGAFLILLPLIAFIPTTKQAAIIFGVPYLIERRLAFSHIEELFCLDCGREQRFCTCEMDDRW